MLNYSEKGHLDNKLSASYKARFWYQVKVPHVPVTQPDWNGLWQEWVFLSALGLSENANEVGIHIHVTAHLSLAVYQVYRAPLLSDSIQLRITERSWRTTVVFNGGAAKIKDIGEGYPDSKLKFESHWPR